MMCPFCLRPETKVTDKRDANVVTRRRRECLKCGKRFTTYERIEQPDVIVVKKDGRRETFSRGKLKTGLLKACEKRPISHEKIDQIVREIEEFLKKKGKEVTTKLIGALCMKKIKKLDKVAYIRFASVYMEFDNIKDFKQEIKQIAK